jgi:hypothetical protein
MLSPIASQVMIKIPRRFAEWKLVVDGSVPSRILDGDWHWFYTIMDQNGLERGSSKLRSLIVTYSIWSQVSHKPTIFEIRGNFLLVEPPSQRISPTVEQMPMTVQALMIRELPPILTSQGLIKPMAMLDYGMTLLFVAGGTSPWPRPGSLQC